MIGVVGGSLCSCGSVIRWKADERESDEWLLAALPDLPDEFDHLSLSRVSTNAAFCPACGHLWVAWSDRVLTEYAPVTDPNARPLRQVAEADRSIDASPLPAAPPERPFG